MKKNFACLSLLVLLAACEQPAQETAVQMSSPAEEREVTSTDDSGCANRDPKGMALFGDVHVHTKFSFDAAANSFGATPVDANKFARGEAIKFFPLDENGEPVGTAQMDRPLDFLAVTDHGEFLGEFLLYVEIHSCSGCGVEG